MQVDCVKGLRVALYVACFQHVTTQSATLSHITHLNSRETLWRNLNQGFPYILHHPGHRYSVYAPFTLPIVVVCQGLVSFHAIRYVVDSMQL